MYGLDLTFFRGEEVRWCAGKRVGMWSKMEHFVCLSRSKCKFCWDGLRFSSFPDRYQLNTGVLLIDLPLPHPTLLALCQKLKPMDVIKGITLKVMVFAVGWRKEGCKINETSARNHRRTISG